MDINVLICGPVEDVSYSAAQVAAPMQKLCPLKQEAETPISCRPFEIVEKVVGRIRPLSL